MQSVETLSLAEKLLRGSGKHHEPKHLTESAHIYVLLSPTSMRKGQCTTGAKSDTAPWQIVEVFRGSQIIWLFLGVFP